MGVLLGYDMKRKREVYFFGGSGVGIGGRGVRLWYAGGFFVYIAVLSSPPT